ncbi:Transmembrane emp24 domain-containing protein 2 [Tyrophagus putrescentiae]|nr:Transmembrane emp24 domain-containing protein 2 [Tyrophagus putrescentiae]
MAILFLFKSLMAVAPLIIISSPVFAYQTTVDVGAKECFFERLATTDKLAIVYDVIDGGFRDLAFSLSAPEGGDLVSADDNDPSSSSSSGRYTFAAAEEGEYRWCFDNGQNDNNGRGRSLSATPKVVKFAVEVFASPSSSAASKNASKAVDQDPDHADRLSLLYLAELGHRLKFAKYESEVAATALVGHHQLSEKDGGRGGGGPRGGGGGGDHRFNGGRNNFGGRGGSDRDRDHHRGRPY